MIGAIAIAIVPGAEVLVRSEWRTLRSVGAASPRVEWVKGEPNPRTTPRMVLRFDGIDLLTTPTATFRTRVAS